ncbi:Pga53 protein [Candida orthopsilosis Co 90-125]|uniref:Pga53 protein n=1 Tax=Candida orthopsilosis (strain 90-125) TaxID=1136231 RepID=H8X6S2_CANO9|nr:Pga53 protein [Candida orthopsilosis Co 90-125]CCG23683.1 Pga53 protein [Candida orthopsilosis Co 90-125]
MKFATVFTLATVTLALNLDQVRLINENELVIQDTEYGYPAIVNLKEEDSSEAEAKKSKSSTKVTTTTSSHVTSATTTTTTHSSKKHSSTSTKHKTSTHSITKTAGADAVAASVGGPLLVALGLLL